jgi:hypothetical protein
MPAARCGSRRDHEGVWTQRARRVGTACAVRSRSSPKTRSGNSGVPRRAIQCCEGRDPGDLTTIEDPARCSRSASTWRSRLMRPCAVTR